MQYQVNDTTEQYSVGSPGYCRTVRVTYGRRRVALVFGPCPDFRGRRIVAGYLEDALGLQPEEHSWREYQDRLIRAYESGTLPEPPACESCGQPSVHRIAGRCSECSHAARLRYIDSLPPIGGPDVAI